MVLAIQSSSKRHIDLDKVVHELSTKTVLKVGWVENKRYPAEEGGEYIAAVAAQNEYGNPLKHIPPRPFMAPAVANNRNNWMAIVAKGAKDIVKGKDTVEGVFDILGAKAAHDVRKAIEAVVSPALSEVTIARRLSKLSRKRITKSLRKPLIDTGVMIAAVTHTVEKG